MRSIPRQDGDLKKVVLRRRTNLEYYNTNNYYTLHIILKDIRYKQLIEILEWIVHWTLIFKQSEASQNSS